MNAADRVYRKIVMSQQFRTAMHPRGAWSVKLDLDCGHVQTRPRSSMPVGDLVRCKECEAKERGDGQA